MKREKIIPVRVSEEEYMKLKQKAEEKCSEAVGLIREMLIK